MRVIDLNVDMGESFGNWRLGDDEALLERATSANIACGFHAGDPVTLLRTVSLASERGVAIGAHPGFPDLVGQCAGVRDPHRRRPIERGAVFVHRRPVHHGVAGAAMPTGVPAAVTEASLMANEDLVRAERVAVAYLARPWLTCRFLRSSVRSCQLCRRQTAAV